MNNFLKSYLSERKQFTRINDCNSNIMNITYGVPQGSILGPLLFTLYINDISQAMTNCKTNLFADDTAMVFTHHDVNTLISNCQTSLEHVYKWFKLNKLSLSLSKSAFLLFHGKNKDPKYNIKRIEVNGHDIKRMNSVKYIGLHLDEKLSWDFHINELCKSLTKYFSVFYNMRNMVNIRLARTVYFTCIHSRIKYGIELYGSADTNKIDKVQTIQNKLMKILLKKHPRYSTNALHVELNIIKVKHIHELAVLDFVYRCKNGPMIPNFSNYYTSRFDIHQHNTRNNRNFNIPNINTEIGRKSMKYKGADLWNKLDQAVQSSSSIKIFRKNITQNFKQNYTIE